MFLKVIGYKVSHDITLEVRKVLDELWPPLKSLKVFFKDHFYTYDEVLCRFCQAEEILSCKDLMISQESTPQLQITIHRQIVGLSKRSFLFSLHKSQVRYEFYI
jgi:hypothetical protein